MFVPHPPRSTKKKKSEDLREGTTHTSLNNSVFSNWSDTQFFNYSKACGVIFPDSPNHKSKCLDLIRNLESDRDAYTSISSVSPSRSNS